MFYTYNRNNHSEKKGVNRVCIQYTLHIEMEHDKLHDLANLYGMSDVRVLQKSQILACYLNDYAMHLQIHSIDSWLP